MLVSYSLEIALYRIFVPYDVSVWLDVTPYPQAGLLLLQAGRDLKYGTVASAPSRPIVP